MGQTIPGQVRARRAYALSASKKLVSFSEGTDFVRKRRGLLASSLLLAFLLVDSSAVDPARAAVDPITAPVPHEHSEAAEHAAGGPAEHAAEDLVGTPMSVIERKTAENAERILRETGVRPGAARPAQGTYRAWVFA